MERQKIDIMDRIKIVEAQRKEISGIAKVLEGTLKQDFVYGPHDFNENVDYSFSASLEREHERVYVAKENDEVVGFAWFMNHPPNNGTAILEMLAVGKDYQRQGIGSYLINESSNLFVESQREAGINLRTLHLTTNLSNQGAQDIYTKAGYEVAGEIKGFVGDGNVEVVMVKRISDEPCPIEYKTQ